MAITAGFALVLSACAADEPGSMATTTDTLPGGAALVRHTPPPEGVPITWRLEDELRIGTVDGGGPAQFGEVGGLDVAEDGRIVVLDRQAQDIRIFDSHGRHVRTLGRKGGGPGELEGANGVILAPDGILRVPDGRNRRISYFDLQDGFLRSHPYTPLFLTRTFDGALNQDGTLWSIHWIPSSQPGERGRAAYVGYDSAGTAVDTIARPDERGDPADDPGSWAVQRDGVMMASVGVPFYARQQHLLDSRLRIWSTVEGDPAYRLERRTREGQTEMIIETQRSLQPVDRAAADSIVSRWDAEFDTRFDRSKFPDTAAAISSFFMDDDGRLWVLANTSDADSTRTLDAYDSDDGWWLGTLATDLQLLVHPEPVIRGDRLWGVVRDELDVPYVVRARLVDVREDPS